MRGFQRRMPRMELVRYVGPRIRIRVSDTLGGVPVTAIGEKAFCDPCGDYRFFGRKALEAIRLPYGLKWIGAEAFSDCRDLKDIVLPDRVTYIGDQAFAYSGISVIPLPMSLREVAGNPFSNKNVIVPDGQPVFCVKDGMLLNRLDGTLIPVAAEVIRPNKLRHSVLLCPGGRHMIGFPACEENVNAAEDGTKNLKSDRETGN